MKRWSRWRSLFAPCTIAWLATACRAPAAPEQPLAPATTPTPPAIVGRSAFVVLTADRTLVIPTDPAVPVETLPGFWVGALPDPSAGAWGTVPLELTTKGDSTLPSLPVCPSGGFEEPCALHDPIEMDEERRRASPWGTLVARVEVRSGQPTSTRIVDLDEGEEHACECVVAHGISTDGPPLDVADEEVQMMIQASAHDTADYLEYCGVPPEPELAPTSYLGGMLYSTGVYDNAGCDGLGRFFGTAAATPLRPGATAPTVQFPESATCQANTELHDLPLDGTPNEELACELDDEEPETEAYALRDGRLLRAVGAFVEMDSICNCASAVPVSASLCPSALDTCGQGRALSERAAWDELWVTTDERLALARNATGLVILAAGRDVPLREEPITRQIIGVEYHPDTALLGVEPPRTAVRIEIPARHESDAAFEGSAKAWGNRCFAHLQAGRLDAAEAACFAGLLEGGTDGTRGALSYNLGRIAEARGDRDRARAYYERSKRLRPNEATAKRLRDLSVP